MHTAKPILVAVFLAIMISSIFAGTTASSELIVNGGFETGTVVGWTIIDNVMVVRNPRSGHFMLRLGARSGPGQVTQSFTLPSGTSGTVSFWYNAQPGDYKTVAFVATLLDQNGAIIMQWIGTTDYSWHQVTYNVEPKYSGSQLTLRFYGRLGFTYEPTDRVCVPQRIFCVRLIPAFVSLDDVSVTYI
jgi:hypothetical protein